MSDSKPHEQQPVVEKFRAGDVYYTAMVVKKRGLPFIPVIHTWKYRGLMDMADFENYRGAYKDAHLFALFSASSRDRRGEADEVVRIFKDLESAAQMMLTCEELKSFIGTLRP